MAEYAQMKRGEFYTLGGDWCLVLALGPTDALMVSTGEVVDAIKDWQIEGGPYTSMGGADRCWQYSVSLLEELVKTHTPDPATTEKAHTPGPWSFDGHGINSENGERIAKVQHGLPYSTEPHQAGQAIRNERFDADSVLLAAAPDLLRELEECVALIEKSSAGYRVTYDLWIERIRIASEVIYKAKGG